MPLWFRCAEPWLRTWTSGAYCCDHFPEHTGIGSPGGAYGLGIIYAKTIYVRWPGELSAALVSDLKTFWAAWAASASQSRSAHARWTNDQIRTGQYRHA
jgi:hypothetical protein